jgi:hypothetical protein
MGYLLDDNTAWVDIPVVAGQSCVFDSRYMQLIHDDFRERSVTIIVPVSTCSTIAAYLCRSMTISRQRMVDFTAWYQDPLGCVRSLMDRFSLSQHDSWLPHRPHHCTYSYSSSTGSLVVCPFTSSLLSRAVCHTYCVGSPCSTCFVTRIDRGPLRADHSPVQLWKGYTNEETISSRPPPLTAGCAVLLSRQGIDCRHCQPAGSDGITGPFRSDPAQKKKTAAVQQCQLESG